MTGHSGRAVTAFWLILAAGLAAVIALELQNDLALAPTVTAAPIEAAAGGSAGGADPVIETPAAGALQAIMARPLFAPSRRPFVAPVDDLPATADDRGDAFAFELVGTMIAGGSRLALLKHPSEGLLRLRRGDGAAGWRIDAIDHDRVRLTKGDAVQLLTLRADLLLPRAAAAERRRTTRAPAESDRKAVAAPAAPGEPPSQ